MPAPALPLLPAHADGNLSSVRGIFKSSLVGSKNVGSKMKEYKYD